MATTATATRQDQPNTGTDDAERAELLALFTEAQQLLEAKKGGDALLPLKRLLQLCPANADAHNLTSVAFGQLGMLDQAEAASRQAIALNPADPGYHLNLANRLSDQKRFDQAIATYEEALRLAPDHIATLKSYMICLTGCMRWTEAQDLLPRLTTHIQDDAKLLAECGQICIQTGERQQALQHFQRAVEIQPDRLDWQIRVTRLASDLLNYQLAKDKAEYVLEHGENPEMRSILAGIMQCNRRFKEMAEHLDKIPEEGHQGANAANLRAMMLFSQTKTNEAVEVMNRTRTMAPKAFELQATRCMYLNYDPKQTRTSLRDAHLDFGQLFKNVVPTLPQAYDDRSFAPDRKLRVGIVSPDLRAHSVAYYIMPFFEAYDRDQFEVIGYAHVATPDQTTAALRERATEWRNTMSWDEKRLANEIRKDRIDILIDLAGLTRNTGIRAFTARPAPIQMTYIGYPNTTGLAQMDYRITDVITDPDGVDDDYTETLIRLPGCFLCFAPPTQAPDLEPGPCEHRGYVTFGSFNNFAKINQDVLGLWADVLNAVPTSRLLLKSVSSGDSETQDTIRQRFSGQGIDTQRITFADYRSTPVSHLTLYNDIDIALDTFPYNGTTTTCEALWMGVPVITLMGDRHASRVGASLLNTVGFPAGIAQSPEEYVLTAKLMAEHCGVLKTTRRTLRETMHQSPLCDKEAHARALEEAFRAVWKIRCEEHS